MSAQAEERLRLAAVALIVAAFVTFAAYLAWGETLDDAAISLAYAKHLVEGKGLVLSQGAEPVEGYSNFLWVLVMSAPIALGLDAIISAKVLGLLLSVCTLLLLARVPGHAERRGMAWLDLLAPGLVAVSLPFALWSLSAMENGLEALLLVGVVFLYIRELDDDHAPPWSSVGFFALAITRPEGIVFWIAAVGHRLLLMMSGRKLSRQDVVWAAGMLVPLAIYHAWHYQYFGELVPNTYFAKADQRSVLDLFEYTTSPSDPGFAYVRSFLLDYWLLPLVALLPFSVLGRDKLRVYGLPLLMLLAGTSATLYEGGDWMEYHRFFSPLLPLLFLCVQEGVRTLGTHLQPMLTSLGARRSSIAGAAIAIGIAAVVAIPSATKARDAHDRPFGAPYSVVEDYARDLEQLAASLSLERPLVLTPDVGGVALTTNVELIDLGGLADEHIARHSEGPELTEYVFGDRRPDIITVHSTWVEATQIADDPRFWTDYAPFNLARDGEGRILTATLVHSDLLFETDRCEDAATWDSDQAIEGEQVTVAGFVVRGTRLIVPMPVTLLRPAGDQGPRTAVGQFDRPNFLAPPENAYTAKAVCVTGTTGLYDGTPVVYVDSPADIRLDSSARVWTVVEDRLSDNLLPPEASPDELAAIAAVAAGTLTGSDLDATLGAFDVDYVVLADDSVAAQALAGRTTAIHATGFSVYEPSP